ncbi:MAG: D-aminoacyl-tRNA deacylase [Akkermansiaceae bacterium]|jgi:D-tyrosyl-tRNA(Tyr) deacylase|nr:D-aminoacyl-tRNA deacylase [Akkermansiaceae bacterium]
MRVVLQRVSEASVTVEGEKISEIGNGFLILLGIESADDQSDIDWLVRKIINMRIFDDKDGKMNLSLQDKNGEALVVSQFTLHASTKKGNRPSFIKAARPELSEPLYESFCESFSRELGRQVGRGSFGAMMEVALINDGPVTIKMDSRDRE